MAKKMKLRVAQRKRVSNGHVRLEVIVPIETSNRLKEHISRNDGLTMQNFLKKAVYDALPVHYEVTEEWTFPFGKYTGETAGTVKQLDPGYIDLCRKNIPGFYDKMEPVNELADSSVEARNYVRNNLLAKYRLELREGERLIGGGRTIEGRRMFAETRYPRKFRFLGYLPD